MKSKQFSDEDLMKFADKETTGERAMDILAHCLKVMRSLRYLPKD